MKLGVCLQALYHLPFRQALRQAADLGFQAVELPVDARSPFVDLDEALRDGGRRIGAEVRDAGLEISALSNHQEGQLLLGPHGEDTDAIFAGDADAKVGYAVRRLEQTARLARMLDVKVVCGFTGCEEWARWFPWPLADGYERMGPRFRDRLLPLLDGFASHGVCFAHECHPRQFAYNLETAAWALELVDGHPAFGFNFDPANLCMAGMDPLCFVAELGERILHVHAKDFEAVPGSVARSGLMAHGPWSRRDRGVRFRVPGWGDIPWKKVISELQMAGYSGVLAVEHEDPVLDRVEGLEMAIRFLQPLVPCQPRSAEPWW
jgi:sugar phosphate isomerase/epimerase